MLNRFVSVFIALLSSTAFAWGPMGHQIVAYVGGNVATDGQTFWQSNLKPLRQLSTVPDRVWKAPTTKPNEAPTHWFQADVYFTPNQYNQITSFPSSYAAAVRQYSEAVVVENGTAPWRIRQLYQLALQSFKSGDLKSGLSYVGTMSHYIGDLSQPLHVTSNYDGEMTGDKGIHAYFETKVLVNENAIRADVETRTLKLLKDTNFTASFNGSLMDALLAEIERSIEQKDLVIKNDKQYGRTPKGAAIQLELAKNRLADGAATLSLILNKLWKETGIIAKSSPMTIQDPKWVSINYSGASREAFAKTAPLSAHYLNDEDDCSR